MDYSAKALKGDQALNRHNSVQSREGALLGLPLRGERLDRIVGDLPGIRLHAGDPALVPPSTIDGVQFEFVRIDPHLPDTPSWAMSECNLLAA
jgi:hypothetical protein